MANGKLASWTSDKTLEIKGRNYGTAYETYLHGLIYWDGTSASGVTLERPRLTITAIGIMALTKVRYPSMISFEAGYEANEISLVIDYLVIAGGGGGGSNGGAGAGAGGYRSSYNNESSGGGATSESSISGSTGVNYTVTVGAGGAAELLKILIMAKTDLILFFQP